MNETVKRAPLLVEAYVESIEQARAAEAAGAGRLELCGPGEGGLTPSPALLEAVIDEAVIPVHVMIRPREGDFTYSAAEFAAMERSIAIAKAARAAGVVFGMLHPDGTLEQERMAALVEAARPLRVACHRAFDRTPDADDALDTLLALGVDLVLTSGHAPSALEGAETLARHVEHAAGRIVILAGGNVRVENVTALVERSGVREVHARATDAGVFASLARAVR